MSDRLRILALEPYYGGSHRAVLDGLVEHVAAEWTLLTLPARKWKWRMRGAAITMAGQARDLVGEGRGFDVVFASTFLNLAEWRGLAGPDLAAVPAVVYFHENQLLYPNRHTAEWDLQFPLTNVTSALSAERCLFNSRYNLDGFLELIPGFIAGFPDHRPAGIPERIAAKSAVVPPPFDPAAFDAAPLTRGERPRIVWPHRWEHDKNPELFFRAIELLAREGLDFEVVVAGQAFRETAELITGLARALGDRLVACEEPPDRAAYARLLAGCDIAVSTADNEFFGIAMIEASYAGCWPVVPDRLAYPEIYPERHRYRDFDGLVAMLRVLVGDRPQPGAVRPAAARYTFDLMQGRYLEEFRAVAERTLA